MKICKSIPCLLLLACGGAGTTAIDAQQELPSEAPISNAVLIDSIEWRGEKIEFYDATTPEDTSPGIVVSQLGPDSSPELSTVLEQQAEYPVTPAELWRAVTRSEVPEVLYEAHLALAEMEGRPAAFQEFDLQIVEKARADFSTLFPLDADATGLFNTANTCWGNGGIRSLRMGQGTNRLNVSTCSSNGTFIRSFDILDPCETIFNANTTVRTGVHNGTGSSITSRHCFATGNQTWQCQPITTVQPEFYFASSFFKNGSSHRLGTGATYLTNLATTSLVELGTATLQAGVTQFGNTSCNGFIQGPQAE